MIPSILASDLDGTLIPADARQEADLLRLRTALEQQAVPLLFVTGRDCEDAESLIALHGLPQPAWIIGDVGTEIRQRTADGVYRVDGDYVAHLASRCVSLPMEQLARRLAEVPGLCRQDERAQSRFKLSFTCEAQALAPLTTAISTILHRDACPYGLVTSIDPFTGLGLIDCLPQGINKAGALAWWCESQGHDPAQVLFCGDSGNDAAALAADHHSVLVGNGPAAVARACRAAHQAAGHPERFLHAQAHGTSGVWEGCEHFALFGTVLV